MACTIKISFLRWEEADINWIVISSEEEEGQHSSSWWGWWGWEWARCGVAWGNGCTPRCWT